MKEPVQMPLQASACEIEKITLPQIVSIKQASEIMNLPPYYLPREPEKECRGRWLSMQIDPFPVRLEQELKYALAYAALVSAAANGRLPRDICQRTNVGYARKCGVLRREV